MSNTRPKFAPVVLDEDGVPKDLDTAAERLKEAVEGAPVNPHPAYQTRDDLQQRLDETVHSLDLFVQADEARKALHASEAQKQREACERRATQALLLQALIRRLRHVRGDAMLLTGGIGGADCKALQDAWEAILGVDADNADEVWPGRAQ